MRLLCFPELFTYLYSLYVYIHMPLHTYPGRDVTASTYIYISYALHSWYKKIPLLLYQARGEAITAKLHDECGRMCACSVFRDEPRLPLRSGFGRIRQRNKLLCRLRSFFRHARPANSAQIGQSRPDSGLSLSHFQFEMV